MNWDFSSGRSTEARDELLSGGLREGSGRGEAGARSATNKLDVSDIRAAVCEVQQESSGMAEATAEEEGLAVPTSWVGWGAALDGSGEAMLRPTLVGARRSLEPLEGVGSPLAVCGTDRYTLVLSAAEGRVGCVFHLAHGGGLHRVPLPEACVSVASGTEMAYAVTQTGRLYQWHASFSSACKPSEVSALKEFSLRQVAAGRTHFVAVARSGECFSGGGVADHMASQDAKGVAYTSEQPGRVRRIHALYGQPVCKVACGAYHTAVITSTGSCFTFGDNRHGQLGNSLATGTATSVAQPTRIPLAIADDVYVDVACGDNHTLLLTASGRVVSFGLGARGQLGHGSTGDAATPKPVRGQLEGRRVVAIAAAGDHSLALCEDGRLFAWGSGEVGQRGDDDVADKLLPSPVRLPSSLSAGAFLIPGSERQPAEAAMNSGSDAPAHTVPVTCVALHTTPVASFAILRPAGNETVARTAEPAPGIYALLQTGSPVPSIDLEAVEAYYANSPLPKAALYMLAREQLYGAILAMGDMRMRAEYEGTTPTVSFGTESILGVQPFPTANRPDVEAPDMCGRDPTARRYPEAALSLLAAIQNPIFVYSGAQNQSLGLLSRLLILLQRCTSGALERVVESLRRAPPDLVVRRFVAPVHEIISVSLRTSKRVSQATISAAKFLELVHRAISERAPRTAFYNEAVSTVVDLWNDFDRSRRARDGFSFCKDARFLLNEEAKARIFHVESHMLQHSEHARILSQRVFPTAFGMVGVTTESEAFLKIVVRRDHIVADAMEQLSQIEYRELLRPMRVYFVDEPGVDEGGLGKEFMMLLMEELLSPSYGMFTVDEDTRYVWLNAGARDMEEEYKLVGKAVALAILNGIHMDVPLPPVMYKKLLGQPVTLDDLRETFPQLGRSLQHLLEYGGPEELSEVFGVTFAVDYEHFGERGTHDLVPGGRHIEVTRANRREYVEAHVQYVLVDAIRQQFDAFAEGFSFLFSVCRSLRLFTPAELEVLLRGEPELDFRALERVAKYDGGYTADSRAVRWFWSIVQDSMSADDRRRLLTFVSGSDRSPVGGLGRLQFLIQRAGPDTDRLPTAHTCFNVLLLPDYTDREKMRTLLDTAIKNYKGFGLQ